MRKSDQSEAAEGWTTAMCFRDCELASQERPIHRQLPRVTRSGISDLMADVAPIGPLETQWSPELCLIHGLDPAGLQPLHYSQKGVLARWVRASRLES